MALMVAGTLHATGAEVVCAFTVEDALRILGSADATSPDAAVLDLSLAGEGAAPVAEALRHLGVPSLIATGYGEAHQATAGPAAAGAPMLCKLFEPEAPVTAVAALILPSDQRPLRAGT